MKSNLLSLAVASAFTGMVAGCNPAPKPDEDAYRKSVDFTSRHMETRRVHPDRFFYQTPDVQLNQTSQPDIAILTHNDGTQTPLGFLTCVEREAEVTPADRPHNLKRRVT